MVVKYVSVRLSRSVTIQKVTPNNSPLEKFSTQQKVLFYFCSLMQLSRNSSQKKAWFIPTFALKCDHYHFRSIFCVGSSYEKEKEEEKSLFRTSFSNKTQKSFQFYCPTLAGPSKVSHSRRGRVF